MRPATEDEVTLQHDLDYVNLIKSSQTMNEDELKEISSQYDSVFFHPVSESTKLVLLVVKIKDLIYHPKQIIPAPFLRLLFSTLRKIYLKNEN